MNIVELAALLNGLTPIIVPGGRDDRGGQLKVTAYPQKKRKRYLTETSHIATGAKAGALSGVVAGAALGGTTAHILNKAVRSEGVLAKTVVASSALRGARTGGIAGLGLGALIGGAIKKSNEKIEQEKAAKKKKLFRHLHDLDQYEREQFGVVLLGLPSDYEAADKLLTGRLGRALAKNLPAKSAQVRAPLPGPLVKYHTAPNPNPSAPSVPSEDDPGPRLTDILDYLKKKNKPSVSLPRSKGGRGWFPERGDIRDFNTLAEVVTELAALVDTKI